MAYKRRCLLERLESLTSFQYFVLANVLEVNEDVGQFQVPVQHIHVVYCFESFDDLTQKEPRLLLGEPASQLPQVI